jgi:hypothetical protein
MDNDSDKRYYGEMMESLMQMSFREVSPISEMF